MIQAKFSASADFHQHKTAISRAKFLGSTLQWARNQVHLAASLGSLAISRKQPTNPIACPP